MINNAVIGISHVWSHETPMQSHVIKMSIELAKKQFSTSMSTINPNMKLEF